MKKTGLYLLAALFLMLTHSVKAQDPLFSQFYNNAVYYNPAAVGLNPGMRASFSIREQWPNLPADLRNYSFSMDMAERNIPGSGGLGLVVLKENAGTGYLKTSSVGLSTAVRVPLQANMVSQVGITTSFVQKSPNWDNLVFTDQLDPVYGNIYETSFQSPENRSIFYPDFAVGGIFRFTESSNTFSAIQGTFGLAVHHLFRPNESFIGLTSPLSRKLAITGDLVLAIDGGGDKLYFQKSEGDKNSFKFNPGFIYESQGDYKTYAMGVNILKSSIYTGVWFRNRTTEFVKCNDLIFMLGINADLSSNTRMKINYTYDFVLSEIRTATGCSHEVSIIIELDNFNMFNQGRRNSGGGGFGFSTRNRRSMEELECCPF